jgi:hypothetical protein
MEVAFAKVLSPSSPASPAAVTSAASKLSRSQCADFLADKAPILECKKPLCPGFSMLTSEIAASTEIVLTHVTIADISTNLELQQSRPCHSLHNANL